MREPICDLDAEESVLGACLISDRAAEKAFDLLEPEHFYRPSHGILFRHMAEMFAGGMALDAITVSAYVKEHGAEVEPEQVHTLATLVPSTSNVLHYARLVKDAWVKRELLSKLEELASRVSEMPAQDGLAAFEEASISLSDRVEGKQETIVGIGKAVDDLNYIVNHPKTDISVPVPVEFDILDEGFHPGRIYILGGYQADGKTAAAMQFATAALEAGKSVGIASLEMSAEDLMFRWAARESGVAYRGIRHGDLTDYQKLTLATATDRMREWRCDIIDDPSLTIPKLRRIQRARRYDLLVVDHLHQMEFKDRQDIERGMKQMLGLSRSLQVPILLLAQLSRNGDWRNPYPPPTMKALRETAMIEAVAAHIWFVYREREGDEHLPTEKARFIVAKNRFGSIGSQKMRFEGASLGFTRWVELDEAEEIVGQSIDKGFPL